MVLGGVYRHSLLDHREVSREGRPIAILGPGGEYVRKKTQDITRELTTQYLNTTAKGNPQALIGRLNGDGTATLPDGSKVKVQLRGLPGQYAYLFNMGGGNWLADATSAQSIQVGGTVKNLYSVQAWTEFTNTTPPTTVAVHATLFDVQNGISYAIPDTYFPDQGKGVANYNNPYPIGVRSNIFFSQNGKHIGILTRNFQRETLDVISDSLEYDDTECALIIIKNWYLDSVERVVRTNDEIDVVVFKPSLYIPAIYPLPSPPGGLRTNQFTLFPIIYEVSGETKYACIMHRLSSDRANDSSLVAVNDYFVVVKDLVTGSFYPLLDLTQPGKGITSPPFADILYYNLGLVIDNDTLSQILRFYRSDSDYPFGRVQSTLYSNQNLLEAFPIYNTPSSSSGSNNWFQAIYIDPVSGDYLQSPEDIGKFVFSAPSQEPVGEGLVGPEGLSTINALNTLESPSSKIASYRSGFASMQITLNELVFTPFFNATFIVFSLSDNEYTISKSYNYSSADLFGGTPQYVNLATLVAVSLGVR